MPESSSRQATQFLRREASAIPFVSWALRDSNPRPSPCNGEENVQVRRVSSCFGMPLSAAECRGVPSGRYAIVMRFNLDPALHWDDIELRCVEERWP